jgi:hypothetical protein
MIYVSKGKLHQVEYLIEQSKLGNHVLFDTETVRRVFAGYKNRLQRFTEEEAYSVEHHIERLIEQPTLAEKRAYLDMLDRETYECVVRTYFNIVENNLYENAEIRH